MSFPRLLLGSLALMLVAATAACSPVRPWQRNTLAHRCMTPDNRAVEGRARQHMLGAREASQGGEGEAGGGCGCK